MNLAATLVGTALNATSLASPRLAGRGAYGMFGCPGRRGEIRTGEAEALATAHEGRLTVGGTTVRTYRWGDGRRPVLYVHGWRSRGSRVASYVPGLTERSYSPISFDAPGHGASDGRVATIFDYREIIRALHDQYGPFEAVIAHSLGAISSFFALRDTVKTARLVTIGGVAEYGYLFDAYVDMLRLRPAVRAELRRLLRDELFAGDEEAWLRRDGTYLPEEVNVPILAFHDVKDPTIAVDQAHRIVAAYGDRARLMITYGLGHNKIVTDPDVVGEILAFVAGK